MKNSSSGKAVLSTWKRKRKKPDTLHTIPSWWRFDAFLLLLLQFHWKENIFQFDINWFDWRVHSINTHRLFGLLCVPIPTIPKHNFLFFPFCSTLAHTVWNEFSRFFSFLFHFANYYYTVWMYNTPGICVRLYVRTKLSNLSYSKSKWKIRRAQTYFQSYAYTSLSRTITDLPTIPDRRFYGKIRRRTNRRIIFFMYILCSRSNGNGTGTPYSILCEKRLNESKHYTASWYTCKIGCT